MRRRFAQLQFGPDGGPDLHPSRRLRAQDAPPHPGFGLRAMVLVPRRDVLDPGIDFASFLAFAPPAARGIDAPLEADRGHRGGGGRRARERAKKNWAN